MARSNVFPALQMFPAFSSVLELFKPITWFAPMWAFLCGAVSSGVPLLSHCLVLSAGLLLAGPLVCATSQAVNDWFDRHVDAINEPGRPIPSGRIPGYWGLGIAIGWTVFSLLFSSLLGFWVFWAATLGLVLSWIYSAPPFRLKQSGWWGAATVALSYEGITWFTGAAVLSGSLPDWHSLLLALFYSIGAHGIMTLNDFKAMDGDRQMGIRSLPVMFGADGAARFACATMAIPQMIVVVELWLWGGGQFSVAVGLLVFAQSLLMIRLLRNPRKFAPWYNATGTTLYVLGMLIAAFAVRAIVAGQP